MNIVVCDDDVRMCESIQSIIRKKYEKYTVGKIDDILSYYKKLERKEIEAPDMMIMDICWDHGADNNSDGIKMSVKLQNLYPRLKIIFLTGFINYATDIFDAKPSAFLVKPVNEEKLYNTIEKIAKEIKEEEKSDILTLPNGGGAINVKIADILYLESDRHELILHMSSEEQHVWMKLEEMMPQLPDYFLRIHQSFAVNAKYIQKFGNMNVSLTNGLELPVSRSRYKQAKEGFFDYLEYN